MHESSFETMQAFRDAYLIARENEPLVVVDYGSLDVNGSFRKLFDRPKWRYTGLDREPGRNVDFVVPHPYHWGLRTGSVDVVISGQALEHTEFFWCTVDEIDRILRPGGLCCLIVPSSGPEHRYPVDCWRFYPDGLRALAIYAGLEPLDVSARWNDGGWTDSSNLWHDAVLIGRKPVRSRLYEQMRGLRRALRTRL